MNAMTFPIGSYFLHVYDSGYSLSRSQNTRGKLWSREWATLLDGAALLSCGSYAAMSESADVLYLWLSRHQRCQSWDDIRWRTLELVEHIRNVYEWVD